MGTFFEVSWYELKEMKQCRIIGVRFYMWSSNLELLKYFVVIAIVGVIKNILLMDKGKGSKEYQVYQVLQARSNKIQDKNVEKHLFTVHFWKGKTDNVVPKYRCCKGRYSL